VKSIFASKTFWANFVAGAVSILTLTTNVVPADYQPIILGLVAALNIYLRSITEKPVTIVGE
jgi:hypothetical protein